MKRIALFWLVITMVGCGLASIVEARVGFGFSSLSIYNLRASGPHFVWKPNAKDTYKLIICGNLSTNSSNYSSSTITDQDLALELDYFLTVGHVFNDNVLAQLGLAFDLAKRWEDYNGSTYSSLQRDLSLAVGYEWLINDFFSANFTFPIVTYTLEDTNYNSLQTYSTSTVSILTGDLTAGGTFYF